MFNTVTRNNVTTSLNFAGINLFGEGGIIHTVTSLPLTIGFDQAIDRELELKLENLVSNTASEITLRFNLTDINTSTAGINTSVVPIPAAIWLFGSALLLGSLAGTAPKRLYSAFGRQPGAG